MTSEAPSDWLVELSRKAEGMIPSRLQRNVSKTCFRVHTRGYLMNDFIYRQQILHSDIGAIADIVKSSGFFSAEEIEIALELAEEKLTQPHDSSYQFLFAEDEKRVHGYTCFGLIPGTSGSYDLYWIAIDEQSRGAGLGKDLMKRTENIIYDLGGKRIYAETSSRHQYQPTHGFYESCGYRKEAVLKDFYMEGDSKIIYVKTL